MWTTVFHPQESISDFYWYYSGKDVMDEAGQRNFSRALAVAKQIFNSLTEYIQVLHATHTALYTSSSHILYSMLFMLSTTAIEPLFTIGHSHLHKRPLR